MDTDPQRLNYYNGVLNKSQEIGRKENNLLPSKENNGLYVRKMSYAYEVITKVLNDSFGILLFGDEQEDFTISEYISDSLSFIQFIIAIEEEIERDLPDDFLNFEMLASAKGFAEKLDSYIEAV